MKKALLVGINKYKPELHADLRGCISDIENMRDILINLYNFDPDNIRVIVDERATREAIIERLTWLVTDSCCYDELMFHFSGHGSQVRDRDGDELDDDLDEILCPHDLNWDSPLTDDIVGAILNQSSEGSNVTMTCDSCHSGTMTRGVGCDVSSYNKPRYIMPPYDIRCRTLDRKIDKQTFKQLVSGTNQPHVLFSACRDDQTAADATINHKPQGAFTWALSSIIRENPNVTYREAHIKVMDLLDKKYNQKPQLSGNNELLNRIVFGGKH